MRLSESVAATARYGGDAEAVFGADAEVIWEASSADYQGSCNVLLRLPDGRFAHYEWTYGSCSGCDEWEASGADVQEIMRDTAVYFDDTATLRRYLRLEDEEARYPTANTNTNGSIPGMIRYLSGGIAREFDAMGAAFEEWAKEPTDA